MIVSVRKYGGFYIGRYETGNLSQNVPVVRKLNTDIITRNWYVSYNNCKNIVTSPYVQTSMIWGCQWDATLRWMNPQYWNPSYVFDGTGNLQYSSFIYYNTSWQQRTKRAGTAEIIPTGAIPFEDEASNYNIYDMIGNVWDWTAEAYNSYYRVARGMSFKAQLNNYFDRNSSICSAYIRDINITNQDGLKTPILGSSVNNVGVRAQLFLK